MEAAAHTPGGYGGVPQSVGKEFVGKDEIPDWASGFLTWAVGEVTEETVKPKAAGIMFVAAPMVSGKLRVLLLKRSLDEENYAGYWNFPGGGIDEGETAAQAAVREVKEEIGHDTEAEDLRPIEDGNATYKLFRVYSDDTFDPKLNAEHTEHVWAPVDELPKPLHPGVKAALAELVEKGIPEQVPILTGDDSKGWRFMAADRAIGPFASRGLAERAHALSLGRIPKGLAYDKTSVRFKDADGRLHLEVTNISKACVNPYAGHEIPGFEEAGLDGDKIYYLLRDPQELAKAAPTFNGIPVLDIHEAVSAGDHKRELVVGATGTDAVFEAPYLKNSMFIWPQEAIDGVEDESQKEISCGYYYRPDMTPGTYEGVKYDGVMRDIVGNHVALVEEGRAGPDVVVGDSKSSATEETTMKKPLSRTAIRVQAAFDAVIVPKLAKDKKVDLVKALSLDKVNRKTVMVKDGKTIKTGLVKELIKLARDAAEPMLMPEAQGAAGGGIGPDDVIMKLVEHAIGSAVQEAPELDEMDPNSAIPIKKEGAEEEVDPRKQKALDWFKSKGMDSITLDDVNELETMMGSGEDGAETEEEKAEREKKANDGNSPNGPVNGPGGKDTMVSKDEMAKAVKKAAADTADAIKKEQREVAEARVFVKPWAGELSLAIDSVDGVYRAALAARGVKADDVKDVGALRHILAAQPKAGPTQAQAHDAAPVAGAYESFTEAFPAAANIALG